MDSKQDLGPIKVVLLGASGTGKSCLTNSLAGDLFKPETASTIGASFRRIPRKLGQDKAYNIECWDVSGQDRFYALNSMYIRGADVVLITLNPEEANETEILDSEQGPQQVNKWQYQISRYTESVRGVSQDIEILYVVTHADKFDDLDQFNGNEALQIIKTAHQPRKGHHDQEPRVFHYSSANETIAKTIDGRVITIKNLLLEALDDVAEKKFKASPAVKKQKFVNINDDASSLNKSPSFFTWTGLFKAAFLFSALSTGFLSLGGVVGGAMKVWLDLDLMLEAIQFGTDWGIGVLIASVSLALVITILAVAWSYYCDHRGDGPDMLLGDQPEYQPLPQRLDQNTSKTELEAGHTSSVVSQPAGKEEQETKLIQGNWYKVTALASHQPQGPFSDFFELHENQTFYAKLTGKFENETYSLTTTDGIKGAVRQEKVHLEAVTKEEAMQHQISNVQKLSK